MKPTFEKLDATDVHMLKSTQPITLQHLNDLFSYINMWKSICKKGIQYHDMNSYSNELPANREAWKEDDTFRLHRQNNAKLDFELHQAELLLVNALKNEPDGPRQSYLDLNSRLTQQLLHVSEEKEGSAFLINLYFKEVKLHASTYPEAKAYLDLLEKHKLGQTADIRRFCRFKLYQKQEFIAAAFQTLLLHTDLFKNEQSDEFYQFRSLLLKDDDLDYGSLHSLMPAKVLSDSGNTPRILKKSGNPNHKNEYAEFQKELKTLDKEIQKKTLEITSEITTPERDKRYGEISNLKEQREMLSYVAEQHFKKIDLVDKADISAKKWVSDNLFDKKKAGKDASKVFFCSVGASVGLAFFYTLTDQSEKINTKKLQKDILNGLIETGLTAVGSYFLGPLGPSFTSKMMPFFRDEPVDRYLQEFSAIRKQMTEGFTEIKTKLDNISDQITTQLNAVVNKLEAHTELSNRKTAFINKKDALLESLKKIESIYKEIYLDKDSQTNEDELGGLDKKIQEELIALISIFYHDKFDLAQDLESPSDNSLCGMFYKYNQEAAVSFHETSRNLLNICFDLENIGQLYLDLREQWFASLAVSILVFKGGKKTDTNQMFHIYWNAFRKRSDFNANLTIELESLKLEILGAGNIELLKNMERVMYSNQGKIDFLSGFGLETVVEKEGETSEHYDYQFNDDFSGKGKFIARKKDDFTNRYVITRHTMESQAKSYYTLYTHQKNQIPVPIQVHFRLLKKDTIGIFNYGSDQYVTARVLDPSYSNDFSGSLEAFFKTSKPVITNEMLCEKWSLPVKNYALEVKSVYPHAEIQVTVYHKSTGPAATIGKYTYPVHFNEGFEPDYTNHPFQIELSACRNEQQASLEVIVKRTSDLKQGKVSIVLSDYAALKKAGLSRGLEGVSTYCIKMPVMEDGKIVETDVRTENLRPFMSNLILAGDQSGFKSEERNHFGEVIQGKTGWRSLNNSYSLRAMNPKTAWFVQLCICKDTIHKGSVFDNYDYTNKYSGHFIFQADGNFVMYDTKKVAIAALGTFGNTDYIKYGYLNDEGLFVVVNKSSKEVKTFLSSNPATSVKKPSFGRNSNRLFVEESMLLNYEFRIESENEEYYVELNEREIDSGHWYTANSFEFALNLRKKGGEVLNRILVSSQISRGDVFPKKYVTMQDDGNLVGYQRKRTSTKFNTYKREVLFASNSNSSENEGCILCVTNEGKVFLAKPEEKKIMKWLVK